MNLKAHFAMDGGHMSFHGTTNGSSVYRLNQRVSQYGYNADHVREGWIQYTTGTLETEL